MHSCLEIKPLTTKDLIYKGYGSKATLSKYVKKGMPRHGVRGNYWFIEEEVRAWILYRGEKVFLTCPHCGELIQIPKEVIANAKTEN